LPGERGLSADIQRGHKEYDDPIEQPVSGEELNTDPRINEIQKLITM